ncbi:MAG: hypothetical protein JNM57_14400 [Cyclobacteriaceae bacterium]|nr:hypothetical protein [Cyclobacteriaceae bacterium]
MVFFRFLLLLFNVVVVTFLIYKLLHVAKEPMARSKKATIMIGGIMLLLAPFGMFFNFFGATPQYFLLYPVAISLFLYLTKQL